jgi:hypothetical protein
MEKVAIVAFVMELSQNLLVRSETTGALAEV